MVVSWQCIQDHEAVQDLIPSLHLDVEIEEIRRVLKRDFTLSELGICVVVSWKLVEG